MMAAMSAIAIRPRYRSARDIGIVVRRNLLYALRQPQLLAFSTIQPISSMLLFVYVFGGALALALPAAANGSYVNWLLPGLLVQFAVFSGGQTAAGLADDLSKGVVDRFRSLPMTRSAVLAGRTFSDLLRTGVIFVLLVLVGVLIGFRPPEGLGGLVAGLAVALVFSFAWSWGMVLLGLFVKTPESVQVAGYLVLFPVTFASSVFVPTATMPVWLRLFTEHQPITSVTNAVRGLVLGAASLPRGETVGGDVVIALLWSIALFLLFAPIAVRAYGRASG